MATVLLATETWYMTADRTKAVKKGTPGGRYLLVRKDCPIDGETAEFFGVETYEAEAVSRVTESKTARITPLEGVTREVQEGHARLSVQKRHEAGHAEAIKTMRGHGSQSRQRRLMMQAQVNAELEERGIPLEANPLGHTYETVRERVEEGHASEDALHNKEDLETGRGDMSTSANSSSPRSSGASSSSPSTNAPDAATDEQDTPSNRRVKDLGGDRKEGATKGASKKAASKKAAKKGGA